MVQQRPQFHRQCHNIAKELQKNTYSSNFWDPGYLGRCSDQATGWMVRGSNTGKDQTFFSPPKRTGGLWDPPILLFQRNGVLSGAKERSREVNHSPPSSAEIKNAWSYTLTPSIFLHGVHRENFNFTSKFLSIPQCFQSVYSLQCRVCGYFMINS